MTDTNPQPETVAAILDELERSIAWKRETAYTAQMTALIRRLRAALSAGPEPEPRWQDLDPSLWQRMKDADPAIRDALLHAWHERDRLRAELATAYRWLDEAGVMIEGRSDV